MFWLSELAEDEGEAPDIVNTDLVNQSSDKFFFRFLAVGVDAEVGVGDGASTFVLVDLDALLAKVGEDGNATLLGDAEPCAPFLALRIAATENVPMRRIPPVRVQRGPVDELVSVADEDEGIVWVGG